MLVFLEPIAKKGKSINEKITGAYGYLQDVYERDADPEGTRFNSIREQLIGTSDIREPIEKARALALAHENILKERGIKQRRDNVLLAGFVASLPSYKSMPAWIESIDIPKYLDCFVAALCQWVAAHAPESVIVFAPLHQDRTYLRSFFVCLTCPRINGQKIKRLF